jgi:hypothetical protein
MFTTSDRALLEQSDVVFVDGVACDRRHLWAVSHARRTAAGATACSIACLSYVNHSGLDGRSIAPVLRGLERLGLVIAARDDELRWKLTARGAGVLGDWMPTRARVQSAHERYP